MSYPEYSGMETLFSAWASKIQDKLGLSEQDQELVSFAITYVLVIILNLCLLIAFGYLFGILGTTLYAAFSSALFRLFTGGAHFSSPGVCALISTLFALGCAFGGRLLSDFGLTWLLLGSLLYLTTSVIRYAPVESKGRPITDSEAKSFQRIALILIPIYSVLTIIIYQWQAELAIASILAVSWQAFTLSPIGQRVYSRIDQLIKRRNCL